MKATLFVKLLSCLLLLLAVTIPRNAGTKMWLEHGPQAAAAAEFLLLLLLQWRRLFLVLLLPIEGASSSGWASVAPRNESDSLVYKLVMCDVQLLQRHSCKQLPHKAWAAHACRTGTSNTHQR
jgi:hypothetical protein